MSTIQLSPLGTYETNIFAESASEIVAFDPGSDFLYSTNSANNDLDIILAADPSNLSLVRAIDLSPYGAGINSVAARNGIVAVAVEAENKQDPGKVVFFNQSGVFLRSFTVGALPDSLTFSPNGQKVVVANEGEPSDDYSNDPAGSISIINLENGLDSATVTTASFAGLDRESLIDRGVRIFGPEASVAQDLEPEFVTVSADSRTAWVTLQENNAIAKVDLASGAVEILPLGYKDFSQLGNELDASNRDGRINLQNQPVFGLYQPDSIATYRAAGRTYLAIANEGDSRDYDGFSEEERVADVVLDPVAFPNAAELQREENLGRLKITNTLGDADGDGDFDELYAYGARSFSIRDDQGRLVFDSGADLEKITAILLPQNFNSSDEENNSFDDRSDDKGPEPEALTVGKIDGRTYAFVGLERTGGVAVYDITVPGDPAFVQYINTRNFEGDLAANVAAGTSGDVSPEGLLFISAADSPTGEPLLALGDEIGGRTTLYKIGTDVLAPAGAIAGTSDKDKIKSGDGRDEIYGLNGEDKIESKGGNDAVYAGAGDDDVKGGEGDDLILGEAGDDKLEGEEGDDLIWGGAGEDELKGEEGNDTLYGNGGDDKLEGKEGNDFLSGGRGNDELKGGDGDDFLDGGEGSNKIEGDDGIDTVTLANRDSGARIDLDEEEIFVGGSRSKVKDVENVVGTQFNDSIKGDKENNKLWGLGGDDFISGDKGDDTLIGIDTASGTFGLGEIDRLRGGEGRDRFIVGGQNRVYYDDGDSAIAGEQDYVRIEDFSADAGDVIQLNGKASEYVLGNALNSTGLFLKGEASNELIAVIDGLSAASDLASAAFSYV